MRRRFFSQIYKVIGNVAKDFGAAMPRKAEVATWKAGGLVFTAALGRWTASLDEARRQQGKN